MGVSLTRDARRCDMSDQTGRRLPLRDSVRTRRQLVQFMDNCGTALMAPPMPVSAASHDSTVPFVTDSPSTPAVSRPPSLTGEFIYTL